MYAREPGIIVGIVQWERKVRPGENVIRARGYNYETVAHQLPLVADTIISAYAGSSGKQSDSYEHATKLNDRMDYTGFLGWIRQNAVLLEYLYEELCPLQWLTHATLLKLALNQSKSARQDPLLTHLETNEQLMVSQQAASFSSFIFDTDRSVSPMVTEGKGEPVNDIACDQYIRRRPGRGGRVVRSANAPSAASDASGTRTRRMGPIPSKSTMKRLMLL